MDPWLVELIVVRSGSLGVTERRSVSRDVERGFLVRIRRGVYVLRTVWDAGEGWKRERARHILRARAFDAIAPEKPVFSHWTAGVIHEVSMQDEPLECVHITAADDRRRGIDAVSLHEFPMTSRDVTEVRGLLVTTPARTVVDIAGARPFRSGVMTADAALRKGLPRGLLNAAVEAAGGRRAIVRITDVAAFANPLAESAAESDTRVSMFELGIEPQELQHEVWDDRGFAGRLDTFDRRRRIGTEVDGLEKFLNPKMAPRGAGQAAVQEKWREDRVRAEIDGLARFGAREARSASLLRPILWKVGLRPASARPTLEDWAAEARVAIPLARR